MKEYVIQRAAGPIDLAAGDRSESWQNAGVAMIDQFPWYKSGIRQATVVRLLYDDRAIYAQFVCQDSHIFSQTTTLNGPVCNDSCVEFFATIDPDAGPNYFNFEANCCGVLHLGFGPQRHDRTPVTAELAAEIKIVTSIPAPTWQGSPADRGWWLAAEIPFDVIGKLAGTAVRPEPGTIWRGNFYRCGGKADPQFGCWTPIAWPHPDYHRPEQFGRLRFA
jgi:hypothetical protein